MPEDVELVRPRRELAIAAEKLIFRMLGGQSSPSDKNRLHKIVGDFKETAQLDAVILGCTELPLIFGKTDDSTIIDTLSILADGLLESHTNITV